MPPVSRRFLIESTLALTAGIVLAPRGMHMARQPGRIKQSVSRWPFNTIPLPQFARAAKEMGLAAIDLLQPAEWPVVQDAGLACSMGYPTPSGEAGDQPTH